MKRTIWTTGLAALILVLPLCVACGASRARPARPAAPPGKTGKTRPEPHRASPPDRSLAHRPHPGLRLGKLLVTGPPPAGAARETARATGTRGARPGA